MSDEAQQVKADEMPLEYLPYASETMRRDEMVRHLTDAHGDSKWNMGSKITKAEMETRHNNFHARAERAGFQARGVKHIHTALSAEDVPREDSTAIVDALKNGQALNLAKPLSKSDAEIIQTIVNNDFMALKTQIQQLANEEKTKQLDALTEKWDKKRNQAELFVEEAAAIAESYRFKRDALVAKANKAGIELSMPDPTYAQKTGFTLAGEAEEKRQVIEKVKADTERATLMIERKRLNATRQITLARVTPEAQQILSLIPKAEDVMRETLMLEGAGK